VQELSNRRLHLRWPNRCWPCCWAWSDGYTDIG